ncbi:uncharacterized protein P884DRAFT_272786 [Thermothelomyces heterothallicus CBS 202.75]|uniref:uncharacterized protein n=1 Tax=Thermothelomyces heterothallicus CBS 202.75 TaxID=1149848 RepID=UPI0037433675
MHASGGLITYLLSFAALATATLALELWLISELTTFSPPDRPGSSPHSVINATISDPNDQTPVTAFCAATSTFEEPPYGTVNACSEVPGGRWRFAMLEADDGEASPTTNFKLRFELDKDGQTLAGTASFRVGENLSGLCSAGGVCSFSLKEESTPFPVKQTLEN